MLVFLASQREETEIRDKVSQITCSMCQSKTREGFCKAKITIDESPSRINFSMSKKLPKS
jgi:hypothetical protein